MLIIKIQNDGTGDTKIGNYRYQVMINDTVIESGSITKHHRRQGWRALVAMLLENSINNEFQIWHENNH